MARKLDPEDEEKVLAFFSAPPLGLGLGLGFGLGLGLGFLFFTRPRSVKLLATAVKVADGAIKSTRALRSPSPSSLLLASNVLLKGYKAASRRLNPATPGAAAAAAKRLRACLGAASLLKYAAASPPLHADGFFGFGIVKCGYEVSKNFTKVLEGFVGLQIDSAVRKCVDAVGLVIKTAAVARELSCWIAAGWRRQSCWGDELRFAGYLDRRYGVCLRCKRRTTHSNYRNFGRFIVKYAIVERDKSSEMPVEYCLSELLCLSIPLAISNPV